MAFFKSSSLFVSLLFVSVIHCSIWEDDDDEDWTSLIATTVQDNTTLSLDVPLLLSVLTAIMLPQIKPPTPPDIPEWMKKFHEDAGIEEPVPPSPPVPPKIPEWMKKIQSQPEDLLFNKSVSRANDDEFLRPKHPKLPEMSIPDLPEINSKGVLNKKPKNGETFEGIAVRTKSDTTVNKKGKKVKKVGISSVANDNGKVKVSKVGDAPPDLNLSLGMPTNPNAKFKSFSTSSFTTSTTVDGVTKTTGGSDTTVQEDDKKESETVRMRSKNRNKNRNKNKNRKINYEAYKLDHEE